MMLLNSESILNKYEKLYLSLTDIIKESEHRVLLDEPDVLLVNNVNFFVKSYLITICTYMEAYIQDIAYDYVKEINERLKKAQIPHNFVHWKFHKDIKEPKYSNIDLVVSKKDITDNLSANPYKVISLFKNLGIDLMSEDEFSNNKDFVNTVVVKRNNIIHHNDRAMDISFSDLLAYIDVFLIYMKAIDNTVNRYTI